MSVIYCFFRAYWREKNNKFLKSAGGKLSYWLIPKIRLRILGNLNFQWKLARLTQNA